MYPTCRSLLEIEGSPRLSRALITGFSLLFLVDDHPGLFRRAYRWDEPPAKMNNADSILAKWGDDYLELERLDAISNALIKNMFGVKL